MAYGDDDGLLALVADKAALRHAFPLDKQRALATADVNRMLRRAGLSNAAIAAQGAEALGQLATAENFGTLYHFFSGFLAPEFQQIAKSFRERFEKSMENIPTLDDNPGGDELLDDVIGLG